MDQKSNFSSIKAYNLILLILLESEKRIFPFMRINKCWRQWRCLEMNGSSVDGGRLMCDFGNAAPILFAELSRDVTNERTIDPGWKR